MKKLVGYLGSALAGGVLGGLIGWFITKRKKKDIQPTEVIKVVEREDPEEKVTLEVTPIGNIKPVVEVATISEEKPTKIEADEDCEPQPILISENDYQFRYPHFNETTIIYYKTVGLFMNKENEVCIEHPEVVLGTEALHAIEQANEGEALYIHDPGMSMNYVVEIADEVADDLYPDDDE